MISKDPERQDPRETKHPSPSQSNRAGSKRFAVQAESYPLDSNVFSLVYKTESCQIGGFIPPSF